MEQIILDLPFRKAIQRAETGSFYGFVSPTGKCMHHCCGYEKQTGPWTKVHPKVDCTLQFFPVLTESELADPNVGRIFLEMLIARGEHYDEDDEFTGTTYMFDLAESKFYGLAKSRLLEEGYTGILVPRDLSQYPNYDIMMEALKRAL